MRLLAHTFLGASLLVLSGCKPGLSFGEDVELSGANFDSSKLTQVSTLTGITFPKGSEGIEYFYQGSGIDDALAAKVRIPNDAINEFKTTTVFSEGSDSKPTVQVGRSKAWWKVDGLSERIDRTKELPNARHLELSLGKEGEDFVVYLSWITT
jgi:hypothetical protein